MAQPRAHLVSHGLEDFQRPLTPIRDRQEPVAASDAPQPPAGESAFPYLVRGAKSRVVPYPVRLSVAQIERLDARKAANGIVPAELIRHAVDQELDRLDRENPL